MNNFKKGEISMDIKIEKENAFSIIVITKQFNEETSFENVRLDNLVDYMKSNGFFDVFLGDAESARGVSLRVLVDHEDFQSEFSGASCDAEAGGCFADSALLIGD